MQALCLHIPSSSGSSAPMAIAIEDNVAQDVRQALAAGDEVRATVRLLDAYGAEVFGFLAGVLDDVGEARAVYAAIGERARERLVTFGWPCGLRTWLYAIAHRVIGEVRQSSASPGEPVSAELPERGTTRPPPPRSRSAALAHLRSSLPLHDREMLVLHVDRRMTWDELALVFLGEDASAKDHALEILRLQARYRLLKDWLAREAAVRGILSRG